MGIKSAMAGPFMKNSGATELDDFYEIRQECQADVPKTRFKPRAGKTLSARKWKTAFSPDGHLDMAKVLRRIQRGGVHPSIKGEVWEFLLGCFDPNSTYEDRNRLRELRREQYASWKSECQKLVPIIGKGRIMMTPLAVESSQPAEKSSSQSAEQSSNDDAPEDGAEPSSSDDTPEVTPQIDAEAQEKKVKEWKQILYQISLDVLRTDRSLVFYESEINQSKLWDILAIYAWVDDDIGYVQGMSDICSPIAILLENEADAFWCFERAMRKVRDNFKCTTNSMGVQQQLSTLSEIMKAVDPKLHQHLEDLDGGQYLFAFRMLMVIFRREFSFVDSLFLWELMWAMEYNPNIFAYYECPNTTDKSIVAKMDEKLLKQYGKFERANVKTGMVDSQSALAVFLAASVLEAKNKRLMKEAKGLDDVAKILGDLTGSLDAKKACEEALKLQKKYLKMKKLEGT
uniref:Rab-GAP TBC domain-containing protein n=2 Tax=Kalanchoe fedtschenkoi TaxID=63787 RepID=A0A7N0TNT5_KALFE